MLRVAIIMGPSGCGKSTVARRAARLARARFYEADDYHTDDAREAMRAGRSLKDDDRSPWIARIGDAVRADDPPRSVLACSALNPVLRTWLTDALPGTPVFFFLDVPETVLAERLRTRPGHYAGPSLLPSQLAALDPEGARRLDGTAPPDDLAREVAAAF